MAKKKAGKGMQAATAKKKKAVKVGRPRKGPWWSTQRRRWLAYFGHRLRTAPADIGEFAVGDAGRWYEATMAAYGLTLDLSPTPAETGHTKISVGVPAQTAREIDDLIPIVRAETDSLYGGPSLVIRVAVREMWERRKSKKDKG